MMTVFWRVNVSAFATAARCCVRTASRPSNGRGVGVVSLEEGVEWVSLVPDDETGRSHRSSGKLHKPGQSHRLGWQSGRVETERPGHTVTSPIEVRQVLPVLVGDCPEFFGCPTGSVTPPRRHETQPHQLRQPERERAGLAVEAHIHHWAFLASLAYEAERVPRSGPRELLQPGPGGEPDPVLQHVGNRVRHV